MFALQHGKRNDQNIFGSLFRKKKNILFGSGEVREMTSTPMNIDKIIKRTDAPTAIIVGCRDQKE